MLLPLIKAIPLLEADEDVARCRTEKDEGISQGEHTTAASQQCLADMCAILCLRYAWFSYFKNEWEHPIVLWFEWIALDLFAFVLLSFPACGRHL